MMYSNNWGLPGQIEGVADPLFGRRTLALGTEMSPPASDDDSLDWGIADRARQPLTLVDPQSVAEPAHVTVGTAVVAERGPSGPNRPPQDRLDRAQQTACLIFTDPATTSRRMNSRREKRLVRIDVA